MPTGPFRPGDQVPITGIYTASHYQHRMPHEVFVVAGDIFPSCRRCGVRASFALAQAAEHITTDQDFFSSAKRQKPKAKASSPKED